MKISQVLNEDACEMLFRSIIVGFIIIFGCLVGCVAKQNESEPQASDWKSLERNTEIRTYEHDGHQYLLVRTEPTWSTDGAGVAMVHSESCPCKAKGL